MRSRTVTAVFPAPKQRVFEYMSDIENLPRWATEFAREMKVVDGRHVVVNGLGEFLFEIEADERSGVIDMYAGPSEDQMGVFPTRVVELPGGASAYSFTMFQAPDMPDELFESQYESLRREFENLEREFAAGA
jgi:hypothetical protein